MQTFVSSTDLTILDGGRCSFYHRNCTSIPRHWHKPSWIALLRPHARPANLSHTLRRAARIGPLVVALTVLATLMPFPRTGVAAVVGAAAAWAMGLIAWSHVIRPRIARRLRTNHGLHSAASVSPQVARTVHRALAGTYRLPENPGALSPQTLYAARLVLVAYTRAGHLSRSQRATLDALAFSVADLQSGHTGDRAARLRTALGSSQVAVRDELPSTLRSVRFAPSEPGPIVWEDCKLSHDERMKFNELVRAFYSGRAMTTGEGEG